MIFFPEATERAPDPADLEKPAGCSPLYETMAHHARVASFARGADTWPPGPTPHLRPPKFEIVQGPFLRPGTRSMRGAGLIRRRGRRYS